MPDFVTLSCPACGGQLRITSDIERFACGHCGREHVVKRGGGIVALAPVVEAIGKVEVGVGKTASELAINRIQREIDELHSQRAALITSSPKPQVSVIFFFLIGTGILIAVAPLAIYGELDAAYMVPGILMAVVGAIPFFIHPSVTRRWQETTGSSLSAIEEDLVRRHEELDRHRRLVTDSHQGLRRLTTHCSKTGIY